MAKKKTLLQGVMDHDPRYIKGSVYVEPKLDGWGTMFRWVEGEVKASTHTGTPLDLPTQCAQVAEVLPTGFFFHTELTHPDGWQRIKSAIAYDPDSLIVNIFDMVSEEFFVTGVDLRGYTKRKGALGELFNLHVNGAILFFVEDTNLTVICGTHCKTEEDIQHTHERQVSAGYEGSIIKRPNGLYNLGKSTDWLRMKPVPTQDCEIVEVIRSDEGEIKSLRVLDEKGVLCNVPHTSFIDRELDDLAHDLAVSMGLKSNRTGGIPPYHSKMYIGKFIEVAYSRLTEAGRMREPRFVRFPEDKTDE